MLNVWLRGCKLQILISQQNTNIFSHYGLTNRVAEAILDQADRNVSVTAKEPVFPDEIGTNSPPRNPTAKREASVCHIQSIERE